MSIPEYNEMTPYEFGLCISAYNERTKQDQEDKLTLTWLGAYWQRVDPKKFPSLKSVLGQKSEPEKEQTAEDMLEQIKKINAELGGTTY